MHVKELADGRSIMIDDEGEPVLVTIGLRPSTTAPARIKAVLGILTEGDDGETDMVPLPFAQAIIGVGETNTGRARKPNGWTPEFRLEMN